jgi:hypothetical protein
MFSIVGPETASGRGKPGPGRARTGKGKGGIGGDSPSGLFVVRTGPKNRGWVIFFPAGPGFSSFLETSFIPALRSGVLVVEDYVFKVGNF